MSMCLSHSSSLRSGKSVRNWAPARLLALLSRDDDRLRTVEHVAELDRADHVLVEDRAAVVDRRLGRLLLEPADDLEAPSARPSASRNTATYSFIVSPSSSLIAATRRPPDSRSMIASIARSVSATRAAGVERHRHLQSPASRRARPSGGRRSACPAASWRPAGCRRAPRRTPPRRPRTGRGSSSGRRRRS